MPKKSRTKFISNINQTKNWQISKIEINKKPKKKTTTRTYKTIHLRSLYLVTS